MTLALFAILAFPVNKPLQIDSAPYGILSFELAGTVDASQKKLDSWSPEACIFAGISLGLDYLFLILQLLVLGFACRHFALTRDCHCPKKIGSMHRGQSTSQRRICLPYCGWLN